MNNCTCKERFVYNLVLTCEDDILNTTDTASTADK